MPWSFLNSLASQSTSALSKLSPPRWLSPAVDLTSKTPSPSSSTATSNVPPPRSKTKIVWSDSFSSPYASDAALGPLMMRETFSPASFPPSFVAPPALRFRDRDGLAALEEGHARVRRAQVDADGLRHVVYPS